MEADRVLGAVKEVLRDVRLKMLADFIRVMSLRVGSDEFDEVMDSLNVYIGKVLGKFFGEDNVAPVSPDWIAPSDMHVGSWEISENGKPFARVDIGIDGWGHVTEDETVEECLQKLGLSLVADIVFYDEKLKNLSVGYDGREFTVSDW